MNVKVIQNIKSNYKQLEKAICNQLNFEVSSHNLTAGHNREQIWLDLFRQIIPKKFSIKQGVFLIDSFGNVSKEVDIAIFDEQYTPYIFNYGIIHFIPIEAVSITVQCKSRSISRPDLNDWISSINDLKTATGGIARMAGSISFDSPITQKGTKPISILCHLEKEERVEDKFDLIIKALNTDKIEIRWNEELKTLECCFLKFNGFDILDKIETRKVLKLDNIKMQMKLADLEVENNSILSLVFQLNQLLMLINNPMLFPHKAYVDMFNGESTDSNTES